MRRVLVHYHEIGLKGKNRPFFVRLLIRNLKAALQGLDHGRIENLPGRLAIPIGDELPWPEVRQRLQHVFGVANFALAHRVPADLEAIRARIGEGIQGLSFPSFRITARRADKAFPLTSEQINREVGAFVKARTGAAVNLTAPALTIFVEILGAEAFVYWERVPGPMGLPVGTGGSVAGLLSGGLDSPVAAYRMMRRGCRVILIHFHSVPFLSRTSIEKVRDIAAILARYQFRSPLYLVPFGEIQREVVLGAPAAYRVVLYRRLMVRIAERIARAERAGALVTGESLGQVASQTLENLAVVEEAASLPILRPLIGMDKEEIVDQARRLGTHDISIIEDQDCCQLFIPPHPATRTDLEAIRAAEAALDLPALVQQGIEKAEREVARWP
jgi:thiamine biosynthesis protein ThiI